MWALVAFGLRCIIAPGFGDIFYNNAFQNGLLLIRLPREEVERIADEVASAPSPGMTVDLASADHHHAARAEQIAVRDRR